jgi:large subunit ribosomal protein L6
VEREMSRVGKQPVAIPSGVKVSIANGEVQVEGPKGKTVHQLGAFISVKDEDGNVVVEPTSKTKQAQSNFGTTRSLIQNMIVGVTEGWTRGLELSGVGFTAQLSGNKLKLSTGYSHDVTLEIPAEVTAKVQKTSIELSSCDKQLVGQIAAKIRRVCPPEPYLGKGIKYRGEQIRRKAGKTGK